MKGNAKVIGLLNEALKAELTAINQYWLHYRMLDNWGVNKLAEYEREESIDEMKHADRFAERILFLDGLPNFQALGSLKIGESVEEILKADLEPNIEAVAMYRDVGRPIASSAKDYVSRDLFAEVLRNEEEHVDFLETQFDMIKRMGLAELRPAAVQARRGMKPGRTIAAATAVSGTLDILFAMILTLLFGRNIGNMLRYVASGPFPAATEWGASGAVLGLIVHFALMGVMAAVFVLAVMRRPALLDTPWRTGIAYGLLTYAVMNLVVVQLRFDPGFPPKRACRSRRNCSRISCWSEFRWH